MAIFKKCCPCVSLKAGSIAIGVIYIVIAILQSVLIAFVSCSSSLDEEWSLSATCYKADLLGILCGHILEIFLAVLLTFGAAMEKAALLLLWISGESLLTIVLSTVYFNSPSIMAFSTPISWLLTVYCVLVVISYYDYLSRWQKVKREAGLA